MSHSPVAKLLAHPLRQGPILACISIHFPQHGEGKEGWQIRWLTDLYHKQPGFKCQLKPALARRSISLDLHLPTK